MTQRRRLDPWAALAEEGIPDFAALVADYLASYSVSDLAKGTRATDRATLRQLVAGLPPQPLAKDARRYLAERIERGDLMPSSANKYRDTLRKVVGRVAADCGAPSPMRDLAKFKQQQPRPRALSVDPATGTREATYRPIRAALMAADPLWAAAIDLMRYVGLRHQEVAGLKPADVRAEGEVWTLRVERQRDVSGLAVSPPKHGSKRTLNLDPDAAEALRYALSVFGRRGDGEAARTFLFPFFSRTWDRMGELVRAVDPTDFPRAVRGEHGGDLWHVFRHTCASQLLDDGYGVDEIWRIMGHKDPRWTFRYCAALRGQPVAVDMTRAKAAREAAMGGRGTGVLRRAGLPGQPPPTTLLNRRTWECVQSAAFARFVPRGGCGFHQDSVAPLSAALPFPPFPVELRPQAAGSESESTTTPSAVAPAGKEPAALTPSALRRRVSHR